MKIISNKNQIVGYYNLHNFGATWSYLSIILRSFNKNADLAQDINGDLRDCHYIVAIKETENQVPCILPNKWTIKKKKPNAFIFLAFQNALFSTLIQAEQAEGNISRELSQKWSKTTEVSFRVACRNTFSLP